MTFKEHSDKLSAELLGPRPPKGTWPLKITYRATNKEVVANARALQLNMVIEKCAEIIKAHPTLDAELIALTECYVDLQHQYEKLQARFFTGDGRSYRKNRGKKKKAGSITSLLK